MSPLGFILLLGLTTPQNQLIAAQQSDIQLQQFQVQASDQRSQFEAVCRKLALKDIPGHFCPTFVLRARHSGVDCYAIRSYIFKRQDGNAPVLMRTTTCTPANTVRPEQVAHPPKGRLVPQ